MPHDIFISYSSHDRPVADAICERLEAAGVRCWIAPRDILPGDTYSGAIIRAISEAAIMLLVFSERANTSPQILREVERAVAREVPVLPVRIGDAKPSEELEFFISTHQWLDALPVPPEQHLDRITSVVQRVLDARRARPQAQPAQEQQPRTEILPDASDSQIIRDVSSPALVQATPPPISRDPVVTAPPPSGETSTSRDRRRLLVFSGTMVAALLLWVQAERWRDGQYTRHTVLPDTQAAFGTAPVASDTTYRYDEVSVKPKLLNPELIAQLAEQHLPPMLRDSGVAVTVELIVRVRENGEVDPRSVIVFSQVDPEIADSAVAVSRQLYFKSGGIEHENDFGDVSVTGVAVWTPISIRFNATVDTMHGTTGP
ncbi:toll/interleukin-1 receptor domain-containing protein [Longimicrobium sp.]|uniref:toll/interleukin-1 receptor domain-containing protein n=1 Tax=Longimicrobium sp. TaxID=2029185 RepID=UPI003B3BAB8B